MPDADAEVAISNMEDPSKLEKLGATNIAQPPWTRRAVLREAKRNDPKGLLQTRKKGFVVNVSP